MRHAAPHSVRFPCQDSRPSRLGQASPKWPYKAVQTILNNRPVDRRDMATQSPEAWMPGEGSSHDGVADPRRVSTRQEFAAELSLVKDHAGLTVRDVAKKIGVPASTLG